MGLILSGLLEDSLGQAIGAGATVQLPAGLTDQPGIRVWKGAFPWLVAFISYAANTESNSLRRIYISNNCFIILSDSSSIILNNVVCM